MPCMRAAVKENNEMCKQTNEYVHAAADSRGDEAATIAQFGPETRQ